MDETDLSDEDKASDGEILEAPVSSETDVLEGTEAEDKAEEPEATEADLPEGVNGMPEDYLLSETEQNIKADVLEHNVADEVRGKIPGIDYAADEVFCLADSQAHAEMIAEAYGGELIRYAFGVANISLAKTGITVEEAVEIGSDPDNNIPVVEPNYIIPVEEPIIPDESDDSLMGDSPEMTTWFDITDPAGDYGYNDPALDPTSQNYQWMHDMINTYGAWGVTTGSDQVTVAVIDSGVLETHNDLAGRVTVVPGIVNDDRDDHASGDGPTGEHGTHVAGIIAATAGNGEGGAGVAPGVNILSLRTDSWDDKEKVWFFSTGNLVRAVNYVAGYEDENWNEIYTEKDESDEQI